ncbi:MAG: imidazole glycerol phosphate synthase subunit HisH [Eggerthellaceae bacterium]|nr:imidazole glycerol phosphate synthase subunit HisH [Eggerthellaceae bacterium]
MALVAIVDYGLEDLELIETALGELGAETFPSSDPDAIVGADGIVMWGMAGFGEAIGAIREKGLERHLKAAIVAKKPFLGINVGMQLLFSSGRESTRGRLGEKYVDALEIRTGSCPALPDVDSYGFDFELPHTGMAAVLRDERCRTCLLDGVEDGQEFFYDHYFVTPTGPWVQAWSSYSITFPAVVDFHGTCFGAQFLPEKSGEAGMQVLRNFMQACERAEEGELLLAQGPVR